MTRQAGCFWLAWLPAGWTRGAGRCRAAASSGGEHPDAAVLRELEEEAGITDVRHVRVAAIYSHVYERNAERPHDSFHHVGMIYEVTPGSFDVRSERDGSTDRCEWFTEHQARKLPLVPIARFAVDLAWPKP